MEYILRGVNSKVICILLLQPDGTICFKRMSSQVDFKQSHSLVSSNIQKTVPPQLATLGITLESRLQLLSVKDGVGVYGIYNATQEMVCCVRRNSNGVYEFETDGNHLQHQQRSPSQLTIPSTQPSRNHPHRPPVQSPKQAQPPAKPSNRCIWCDSFHHLLASCPHLLNAVQTGQVSLDKDNRVVNAITGQEFIPMLGHGGMMAQM
jgi:hypothetical protein